MRLVFHTPCNWANKSWQNRYHISARWPLWKYISTQFCNSLLKYAHTTERPYMHSTIESAALTSIDILHIVFIIFRFVYLCIRLRDVIREISYSRIKTKVPYLALFSILIINCNSWDYTHVPDGKLNILFTFLLCDVVFPTFLSFLRSSRTSCYLQVAK